MKRNPFDIKTHAQAIMRAILKGETLVSLERRFDNGRSNRIGDALQLHYGLTATSLRGKVAAGSTAIVTGPVYCVIADVDTRFKVAYDLVASQRPPGETRVTLLKGDYEIWVFDGVVCVQCSDHYAATGKVYQRIYHIDLDTEDPKYRGEHWFSIHTPESHGIPVSPQTIARQFGLIWFPDSTEV